MHESTRTLTIFSSAIITNAMKSISRTEMLQVSLALLGLLFACSSAAIIISLLVPGPSQGRFASSLETDAYLAETGQHMASSTSAHSTIRGHRRLELNATDFTTASIPSTDFDPVISPSSSPTAVYEQILPPLVPVDNGSTGNSATATDSAPAIVVGFAGCIIVFAALLYAHDVRERFQEKVVVNVDKVNAEINVAEGETSAGSIGESGYWINTGSKAVAAYPALPPLANESSPHQDEYSISRLTTMTESRMESPWSFGVDEKLMALETSSQVTELSDEHLVPLDTSALATLMSSRRDDDSLTSIDDEEALYGEKWDTEDDVDYEPMDSPRPSFDISPSKYYTPGKFEECDAPTDIEGTTYPIQFEGLIPRMSRSDSSSTVDLTELKNAASV